MSKPEMCRWKPKRQQSNAVRDRFLGCMLGGAVGDALGAPVEFMTRAEIQRIYGTRGITEFIPAYGRVGAVTDDTQMTLFTAEGLLRGWVQAKAKGTGTYLATTAHAYLRWLRTQGETNHNGIEFGFVESGWLVKQPDLHSRRAPGNTCLSALRAMRSLGEPAHNDSKGCGGLMRSAPVGLFAWRLGLSPQDTLRLGFHLAALTHGHPAGGLSGGFLAVLVMGLADGASLPEVLLTAKDCLRLEPHHEETLAAVESAEALATSEVSSSAAIVRMGGGWIAEEALAISIYCALVATDFREGVILAVNHDGDSDSTGAIAGNLLGVMHGVKAIPNEWLASLELRSVITEIADDLYSFPEWEISADPKDQQSDKGIWQKYPGS